MLSASSIYINALSLCQVIRRSIQIGPLCSCCCTRAYTHHIAVKRHVHAQVHMVYNQKISVKPQEQKRADTRLVCMMYEAERVAQRIGSAEISLHFLVSTRNYVEFRDTLFFGTFY